MKITVILKKKQKSATKNHFLDVITYGCLLIIAVFRSLG